MSYFTYAIVCKKTNEIFVGQSKSENPDYNPIHFFIKKNKTEPTYYEKLCKSIKTNGRKEHRFIKTSKPIYELEEAEQKVYEACLKLEKRGQLMNDRVLSPEKETCKDCGKTYKVIYREAHQTQYCDKLLEDAVEGLFCE